MEAIKVSVLCLAYNHEKYIRSALEGFVSQKTSFRYEVIIHDDASTDRTAEIIQEYERRYPEIIKPVYQIQNQHSRGKNIITDILIPKSSGAYIAFCEGDDYWTDNTKLQQQFDHMETGKYSMCVHKVACCNEDDTFNAETIPSPQYGLWGDSVITPSQMADFLYKKEGYPFHTSSLFLRRELLLGDNYSKLAPLMNGDAVCLRLASTKGDIYYINNTMSNRRLMTVGNWNSRFQESKDEIKIQYHLHTIKGEQIFDGMSQGLFHEYITYAIYVRFLFLLKHFDSKDILKEFEEYRKCNRFPRNISLRTTVAYSIYRLSPILYRKIAKRLK